MTLIFLKTEDGADHHAILNTAQICFMEGFDVTTEHPGGSKTRIMMASVQVTLHSPYKVIADQIAKAIEQGYVLDAQLSEARRKAISKDMKETLVEALGGPHHNHD